MSDETKSKLPIWLIVSLMANALLIGLMIGGGLGQRRGSPPPSSGGSEQALIRGINQAVPEDQRRAVRRAFRSAFSDAREQRLRVREARRELGQLLGAETYDPEAVRQGFEELRNADAVMKSQLHDTLAEQFGTLTADQRQAILRDANRRDSWRRDRERERPRGPRRFEPND